MSASTDIQMSQPLSSSEWLSLSGVYKIVNVVNGKWYIGSTTMEFRRRFFRHRSQLRKGTHPNPHLQSSYDKHGEVAFRWHHVHDLNGLTAEAFEQRGLEAYCGSGICYNISPFVGAPMKGRKHTTESILAIADSVRRRSRDIGENTRRHLTGRNRPDCVREKIRQAHLRVDQSYRLSVIRSPEVRERMSFAFRGKPKSPEWVAKIRAISASPEYRKKMSASLRGRNKPPEWRAKIAEARSGLRVSFRNANGHVIGMTSLRDFATTHKLNRKSLARLARGLIKSYRGWTLI